MSKVPYFPIQESFFQLYPLTGDDVRDIAQNLNLAHQTVHGWIAGHGRIHLDSFDNVILPILRRRYPNIDQELIEEVRKSANPEKLRRQRRSSEPNLSRPRLVEAPPAPAPTAAPVADVLAALTTFRSLSIMLAGAHLTDSERVQLIKILVEGHR